MNDMQLGKAGEHLVCFDLIKSGYNAYLTEQGLPYDIILDDGVNLFKIQVKTTREPVLYGKNTRTKKYLFNINRCVKREKKKYNDSDVDIFALVGIDKMVIGYLPKGKIKTTMFFLSEGEKPIKSNQEEKENIKKLFLEGKTLKEVSEITQKDKSYCLRVKQGKEDSNFKRLYLSDFKINDCLLQKA